MAIFEKLAELKTIELEATTAQDTYNKVESELVELVGNYVIGSGVHCLALGDGTIVSYSGNTLDHLVVEIKFASGIKKFSLPHIVETGRYVKFADIAEIGDVWDEAMTIHNTLTSKIRELHRLAIQQAEEAKKKAVEEKKAEKKYQATKEKAIKDFEERVQTSVTKSAENEFYYSLGWLAKHAGTLSVALPDYLLSYFERHFGTEVKPTVVDSKKKTINGNPMQWALSMKASIIKKASGPVPSYLVKYLNTSGNAIADTAFVWDLVDNYGFKFGKAQDVDKIRGHVPSDCLSSFEAGFAA